MSPTTTSSDLSVATLTERVTAAASLFPADGLVAGPADSQDEVSDLLPSEDALVLVAGVAGAPDQRLLAVVNPALLTPMGLSDADGLADSLAPVLTALADSSGTGAEVVEAKVGIGPIGLAEIKPSGGGSLLVAAGLFLGSDHVATIGAGVVAASETAEDSAQTESPHDDSSVAATSPADAIDSGAAAEAVDLPEVATPRSEPATSRPDPSPLDGPRSLNLLRNVEMNVTAELGRTRLTVSELLSLTPGSVVELDRAAGTPIDVMVNGTLIAKGEVVVIDEEFGVRISEIVDRVEGV